jgi:hypothetical protein
MSRIELCKLYSRTRFDGAPTLSGRMGAARLRIEPNPNHDADDPKSPDFLAFIEEAPAQQPNAQPYRGPQLTARPVAQPPRRALPQSHVPFSDSYVEGEVVE